jgi:hypothetical protein
LNSGHLGLRTATKTKLLNNASSRWIVQMNDALTPVYAWPSTSPCYEGTTTKMFRNVSLWSATWYWNGRLAKMASTSWQLHGKGHTSSRLLHDPLRIGLQDLTTLTCPTPSISTSLGVFTLNSQIQICTFFCTTFVLWIMISIYSTIVDYTCLHCWFYNYNNFLINQYIDHQFSWVLRAALSSTSLIACTRSALCVLGDPQMPFGQTSCTLTCIQALTALHSDQWPLQSRIDLQDDIDYAGTTKTRTFCRSNLVLIDDAGTSKIEHSAVLT